MEELLKNKKTFSASEIFMHTKNIVFNSETILKAEKKKCRNEGEKRLPVKRLPLKN